MTLARRGMRAADCRAVEGAFVTLVDVVQYGDFECPECGRATSMLSSFRRRFADAIRLSYRHFPLDAIHPHATQAAEAAECARAQGLFWKMHDLLMANQNSLALPHLYDYAERAGLDMKRFDSAIDEEKYLPRVLAHKGRGISAGVAQTPAFLVNGVLLDSSCGLRSLYEATENAIACNALLRPSGPTSFRLHRQ